MKTKLPSVMLAMLPVVLLFFFVTTSCDLFLTPLRDRDEKNMLSYGYHETNFQPIRDGYLDSSQYREFDAAVLLIKSGSEQSLIKFDLSEIPAGASVISAELYLVCQVVDDSGSIYGYPIVQSWSTSSLTWPLNPASFYDSTCELFNRSVTLGTDNGATLAIDVREIVQGWVTDTLNYGILISAAGTADLTLYSRETGNGPLLTVRYEYYD